MLPPEPGSGAAGTGDQDQARPSTPPRLGRYRLVEPLGVGAFATVWRGSDDELAIPVAVKVLADNWSLDADIRHRFLAEARILRRIDDPRIVRVHDVGERDGRPYFVMDLIQGGTLADLADDVTAAERLRLAAEAAYAVQVLHDAGVAHRDVKPSNLLVDRTVEPPRVLVADLGTAKLLADGSAFTLTAGTPAYMAPEAALGAPVDGRGDVYAIGAVTYELLTGATPYGSTPPQDRVGSPPPVAAGLGLPKSLDRILASALATDPALRPRDARALGDLLNGVAGDSLNRSDLPRRAPRRVPLGWVVLAAVVIFAVAFGVAWLLS